MKKGCRLCGGKLRNGICTECGMDNRKSDEMYNTFLNQDECKSSSLSHVHKSEQGEPYKASSRNAKFEPKRYEAKRYTSSSAGKGKNQSKGKLATIVTVAALIISVGSFFLENAGDEFSNLLSDTTEEIEIFTDDSEEPATYDPYGHIEEELNPVGEHWEQEMEAGMYVVGVDIPEGEYTVTGQQGSMYSVSDKKHYLSDSRSFGEEEGEITSAEGVKLFYGAVICVDGMHPVSFATENAQTQNMLGRMGNPLTERIEVSNKEVTAGVDFPAGTYDIQVVGEEFGVVQYEVPTGNQEDSYPYSFSVLMEETPTEEYPNYSSAYKNVVLPEGTVLKAETLTITLTPSPGIITEDYQSFYDNMY